MSQQGLLAVICGPSGVGKGTLLKLVRDADRNISYSVSATTRSPREGEIEGQNYFFKTIDEFKRMIEHQELVEWVEYCGNYYGTPQKHIESCLLQGQDIILEIEVEGALHIKQKFPDSISIFILPPSFDELKKRIIGRGTEKDEVIEKRLLRAEKEIRYVDHFDFVVINDNVEDAAKKINCILTSEKLKYIRNKEILNRIGM